MVEILAAWKGACPLTSVKLAEPLCQSPAATALAVAHPGRKMALVGSK